MEKKQTLKKLSTFLVFKASLFFFILMISGCWERNPDYENQLLINNTTLDTLYFQATKMYIDDYPFDEYILLPGTNRIGKHDRYLSMEIIEKKWKYRGDTIDILRKGYNTIKWAGPLREMPDSVHHFFNKNSWEIKMGGHKDDWEIATFTLTEDDFVKQE
ncbi:MAG TPA: hypothetical protein PKV50_04330 [Prolixibacteraceae bacterium]|nr:hypothetical protein [Prolixibacteraceae bacterium]